MTVEYYQPTKSEINNDESIIDELKTVNRNTALHQLKCVAKHLKASFFDQGINCPFCVQMTHKVDIVSPSEHTQWSDVLTEYIKRNYWYYDFLDEVPFIPQEPKEKPITVSGNSRQRIINNGKHSWPGPKLHKGRQ